MTAKEICEKAAALTANERENVHGNKLTNHENIAALWEAYLYRKSECRSSPGWEITALDAANMMELLKIARRLHGAHNIDDYIDGAGYAACAGEIADGMSEK